MVGGWWSEKISGLVSEVLIFSLLDTKGKLSGSWYVYLDLRTKVWDAVMNWEIISIQKEFKFSMLG